MALRKYPYGYKIANGKIEICEEEEKKIKRIYREFIEGKSMYKIAAELFEEEDPYFSDTKKKAACKVSAILRDRRYTGDEGYPPIIDTEIFEKTQGRGKAYAVPNHANKKEKPVFEIKTDTIYRPTPKVKKLEQELMTELKSSQDSEGLRDRILHLAAEKYRCIR